MGPGVVFYGWQDAPTLESHLERLRSLVPEARALVVVDDAPSADLLEPLLREGDRLVRNRGALGCGARQQAGYRVALKLGLDPILTLPHGLPPELVERLIAALRNAPVAIGVEAGSRGLASVGLSALSWVQRRVTGLTLSGPPTGCRGVSADALAQVSWEELSPGSAFDVELPLALSERNFKIAEVPIPARGKGLRIPLATQGAQAAARAGIGRLRGRLAFPGPAAPPRGEAASVQRGRRLPLANDDDASPWVGCERAREGCGKNVEKRPQQAAGRRGEAGEKSGPVAPIPLCLQQVKLRPVLHDAAHGRNWSSRGGRVEWQLPASPKSWLPRTRASRTPLSAASNARAERSAE